MDIWDLIYQNVCVELLDIEEGGVVVLGRAHPTWQGVDITRPSVAVLEVWAWKTEDHVARTKCHLSVGESTLGVLVPMGLLSRTHNVEYVWMFGKCYCDSVSNMLC